MSDIANTPATLATIAPGGEVASTIDAPGDQDWFRAELLGGFNYDIRMRGDGSLDALPEPEILVFNESGEQIFNADVAQFSGSDQSISAVFTAPRDGIYFIAAAGDDGQEQGTYLLELLADEASSATNTPATINPGETVSGLINGEGDVDWYRADLSGGFNYDIRMSGDGSFDALPEPEILVFNESGEQIFNADVAQFRGSDQSISAVFTAPRDGIYFIAAAGDDGQEQGIYELSLGTDEAASATVTPLVLRPGQTVEGEIGGFGDRDWYRTALIEGQQYTIEMTGDGSADSIGQVEIAIYDDVAVFLGGLEDSSPFGAETALFTAPETGTYYIAALGEDDDHIGRYRLSLSGDDGRGIGLSTEEAETVAYTYEAGLDRDGDIDLPGLNFWINQRENGLSEIAMAGFFLDSDEFQDNAEAFLGDGTDINDSNVRNPAVFSNDDFVIFLYENVLDRMFDEPGFDFWSGVLEGLLDDPDRAGSARERMLLFFAESTENRNSSTFVETLTEVTPGEWDFLVA